MSHKERIIIALFTLLMVCKATPAQSDGPVAVNYGDVYKKGELRIEHSSLSTLPPLPTGYAALNNSNKGTIESNSFFSQVMDNAAFLCIMEHF
jgi:hypothetical protein